jgi:hypothetical protein
MVRLASGGESRKGDSITHALSCGGVVCIVVEIEVEDESEVEGVEICLSLVVDFCLTKTGLPPSFPAFARIFLISSSRIIRLFEMMPVSGHCEATP